MNANVDPKAAMAEAKPARAKKPKKVKKPKGRPVEERHLPLLQLAIDRSLAKKGEEVGGADAFETEVLPLFNEKREDFLSLARRVAAMLHKKLGRPICVDDVRKVVPPPEDADPRVMGAIFRTGDWANVGYENSTRRVCHGRPIAWFEPAPL